MKNKSAWYFFKLKFSLAFVSPEQGNGNKAQHDPDQQTDLYSFNKKADGQT